MIEKKLQQAAEALPVPTASFEAIKSTAEPDRPVKRNYRLAAAIAAVILLVGCGATAVTYGNYSGFSWASFASLFGIPPLDMLKPGYEDAQKEAEQLGISIPEAFGNSVVYQFETINTSSQGNWVLSWLDHDYQRFWLSYGIEREEIEQEYLEDGTPGRKRTTVYCDASVSLVFGAAEGEFWRELFDFDESGVWRGAGLIPETYETIEYKGRTLQTGTTSYTYDHHDYDVVYNEEKQKSELKLISVAPRTYYNFYVTWVDEANGVVFLLRTDTGEGYDDDLFSGVSQEALIEYAKQLIDMNS